MKTTRYHQVYEHIRRDILHNKYIETQRLPSNQSLCVQYNVSRNTIRHTLQLLEDNGFIECTKGNVPIVLYDSIFSKDNLKYRETLVAKKQAIQDIYKTLAFFMPTVAKDALLACSSTQKKQMVQQITEIMNDNADMNAMIEPLKSVYIECVSQLQNKILVSLLKSMLDFAFFSTDEHTLQLKTTKKNLYVVRNVFLKQFVNALVSNAIIVEKTLPVFCNRIATYSSLYIEDRCHNIQPPHLIAYVWENEHYQEVLYMKVCIDLLQKIQRTTFAYGTYLPSIQTMMKQYHVSKNTIRKACEVLQDAKLIDIKNGIGSRVLYNQEYDFKKLLSLSAIQDYVSLFINSYEIFIWIFQNFTKQQLLSIPHKEYLNIVYESEEPYIVFAIFEALCKSFGPTLYTICLELRQSYTWYYILQKTIQQQPNFDAIMDVFYDFKEALRTYEVIEMKRSLLIILHRTYKQLKELS